LIRNTPDNKNSLPFMSKPDPVTEKLQARVKNAFDPRNILNPGRMGF
ncbi:MAG: 2-hydroxy-acid oxidase, partial [Kordiimonadaceae bacterium]|nr:2-hydroxy-acid oxidase [Kordiimonadaceae bacterium]